MKKIKTVFVANSFKPKDMMFERFTKGQFKARTCYRGFYEGDDIYVVLIINDVEHFIYLPYLDKMVKDPRFEASFSELTLEWVVENGLPSMEDAEQIEEWLDKDEEEFEDDEEEYYEEYIEDFTEPYTSHNVIGEHGFDMKDEQLAVGVLEALRGVESLNIGLLLDDEKEKLSEALKGLVESFSKSSDIKELFMAQYLLFNMISLAKNKW